MPPAHTVVMFLSLLAFGMGLGRVLSMMMVRMPQNLIAQWRADCADFLGIPHVPVVDEPVAPSSFHPIPVAIIAALIVVLAYGVYGGSVKAVFAGVLGLSLLLASGIDIKETLLLDQITLPLLWVGLVVNINGIFTPLGDAVIGAVAGYMSLWLLNGFYSLVRGVQGMGHGDFKLLAALGAWLGWTLLPFILLVACAVGVAFSVALMVVKKSGVSLQIPFGPFLAVGGWIALMWGEGIATWYLTGGLM